MTEKNKVNKRIRDVYNEWEKEVFLPFVTSNKIETQISIPFITSVSEKYTMSDKRIMIVGQEQRDWSAFSDKSDWDAQVFSEEYLCKQLWGEFKNYKYNRSPFWDFFRVFAEKNIIPCWNNIDKCHRIVSGNTEPLTRETEEALNKPFGNKKKALIQYEIDIAKPDALVFIIGPNYIKTLEENFQLKENSLLPKKVNISEPVTDITEQLGLGIPAIWTYHPRFLNTKGLLTKCEKKILSIMKGYGLEKTYGTKHL